VTIDKSGANLAGFETCAQSFIKDIEINTCNILEFTPRRPILAHSFTWQHGKREHRQVALTTAAVIANFFSSS
jgi:hypothetical protein